MRQVKSQALRTGVIQDWGVSTAAASVERAVALYIKQALKQVSRYPVSVSGRYGQEGLSLSMVYYKYIQRARYRRSVLYLVRSAALKGRTSERKVLAAQSYTVPFKRLQRVQRAIGSLYGFTVSVNIRNIYSLVSGNMRLDLLTIQRYYTFNRFKNLMYTLDLVQSRQLAVRFGTGPLFADVFSKGLIRNRRKGQRRFLRLVQAVIGHARDSQQVQYRPDGWRLELFGKVDGQLRAKRHLLKFGSVSYQNGRQSLNYVQRTVATKFGTFGLKLWLHLNEYINTSVRSWHRGLLGTSGLTKRPTAGRFQPQPPRVRRIAEARSESLLYKQPKPVRRIFGRPRYNRRR